MPFFKKIISKIHNNFQVSLYECDIKNEENLKKLKEYLISKVKAMKVHNMSNYDINYYGAPNLSDKFRTMLNKRIAEITKPQTHAIEHFDVRRERITEWMGQLLLEKEFNCIFYDEADKRINIDPVSISKHTPGVDLPGIRLTDGKLKFVVGEIKASDSLDIPCSSASSLLNDIKKGYNNHDERVTKEILNYIQGIGKIEIKDELLNEIFNFLTELLHESSSHEVLVNSVIFFPLLIRNNSRILNESNINDFKNFNALEFNNIDMQGILLSFGTNITDFSNKIYNEAISNE